MQISLSSRQISGTSALADQHIHIWRFVRDIPSLRLQELETLLSSDEKERAYRFYFSTEKNRFIAHRAVLRLLLGLYLGMKPHEIHFSYNPQGKPILVNASSEAPICFSLSHSQELALYAFTMGRQLGVDLEAVRIVPDAEKIAERYFTGEEAESLKKAPPNLKSEIFLRLWTTKEAYIKALGLGLSLPLNQFEAAKVPGWSLRSFVPAPRFIAALAVKGKECEFELLDALRALGYVTARDRLFQMDLMRRAAAGRLAEVIGKLGLESDVRHRVIGFNRMAPKWRANGSLFTGPPSNLGKSTWAYWPWIGQRIWKQA